MKIKGDEVDASVADQDIYAEKENKNNSENFDLERVKPG